MTTTTTGRRLLTAGATLAAIALVATVTAPKPVNGGPAGDAVSALETKVASLDTRLTIAEAKLATLTAQPSSAAPSSVPSQSPTPAPSTASSCTVTVPTGGSPQTGLASIPASGGVLCLPFAYTSGLTLTGRTNVAIDGQGTGSITTSGCGISNGMIVITGGSGIAVRNITLQGTNAQGGTVNAYHAGCEDQGGVMAYGASNVDVANVTIQRTNGECIYVDASGSTWSSGVTFHDSICRLNGRMGVAVAAGTNVSIQRVAFSDIAISVVDLEPYAAAGGAKFITLSDSTVNRFGWTASYTAWLLEASGMVTLSSPTAVSDVTIARNTISAGSQRPAGSPASTGGTTAGLAVKAQTARFARFSVTDNVSTAAGPGPAIFFQYVDTFTVARNTQPLSSGSLVWQSGCTGGSVS